jgi:choline dehydrogenase
MGKPTDPMSVVNSRAQVIGFHHLRVVDASSFALLPPGHPESTVCRFCSSSASSRPLSIVTDNKLVLDVLAEKIAADILATAADASS